MNKLACIGALIVWPALLNGAGHGRGRSLVGHSIDAALAVGKSADNLGRADRLGLLAERLGGRAKSAANKGKGKRAERLALLAARLEERGVARQIAKAGRKGTRGDKGDGGRKTRDRSRKNLEVLQRVLNKVPEHARKGIERAIANASKAHGNAYGHDKGKAQGNAYGHDKDKSKGKGKGKDKGKGNPDHAGGGKGKDKGKSNHAGGGGRGRGKK